jgi:hypothetical protein
VAAAQDGEQNQCADDGNNDRAKTAEAIREESEHRLISSGDASSFAIVRAMDGVDIELQHSLSKHEFRSCYMMRWIFRLIAMTVAAKLVNRYLGSRQRQPRSRG